MSQESQNQPQKKLFSPPPLDADTTLEALLQKIEKRSRDFEKQRGYLLTLIFSGLFCAWIALLLGFGFRSFQEQAIETKEEKVPGFLILRVLPKEAKVWLDKKPLTKDKRAFSLSVGNHTIRVEANGYQKKIRTFHVYDNDSTVIRVALKAFNVPVEIRSEPSGAKLFLNGRPMGKTPFRASMEPRWYRARLEKSGYVSIKKDFRIQARKKQDFSFRLGGAESLREQDKAKVVWIPGRYFSRGTSKGELRISRSICDKDRGKLCPWSWFSAELPQKPVYVNSFWMDQKEVTFGQYEMCVEANICEPPAFRRKNKKLPVFGVTRKDAKAYCEWVGARLPTEAEWEFAARGTKKNLFPWGLDWKEKHANHGRFDQKRSTSSDDESDGYRYSAPVGSFPKGRSPYRLDDMAGNVSEWVEDCYYTTYYRKAPEKNPVYHTEDCLSYVVRGGSWMSPRWETRTAYRLAAMPNSRSLTIGFRCALSGPKEKVVNRFNRY